MKLLNVYKNQKGVVDIGTLVDTILPKSDLLSPNSSFLNAELNNIEDIGDYDKNVKDIIIELNKKYPNITISTIPKRYLNAVKYIVKEYILKNKKEVKTDADDIRTLYELYVFMRDNQLVVQVGQNLEDTFNKRMCQALTQQQMMLSDEFNKQKKIYDGQIASLSIQVSGLIAENQTLREQIRVLIESNTKKDIEIDRLNKEHKVEIDRLNKIIEDKNKLIEEKQAKIKELEDKITKIETDYIELKNDNETLHVDNMIIKNQARELKNDNETLHVDNITIKNQARELKNENVIIMNENADIKIKLNNVTNENSDTKTKLNDMTSKNHELEVNFNRLQAVNENFAHQLNKMTQELTENKRIREEEIIKETMRSLGISTTEPNGFGKYIKSCSSNGFTGFFIAVYHWLTGTKDTEQPQLEACNRIGHTNRKVASKEGIWCKLFYSRIFSNKFQKLVLIIIEEYKMSNTDSGSNNCILYLYYMACGGNQQLTVGHSTFKTLRNGINNWMLESVNKEKMKQFVNTQKTNIEILHKEVTGNEHTVVIPVELNNIYSTFIEWYKAIKNRIDAILNKEHHTVEDINKLRSIIPLINKCQLFYNEREMRIYIDKVENITSRVQNVQSNIQVEEKPISSNIHEEKKDEQSYRGRRRSVSSEQDSVCSRQDSSVDVTSRGGFIQQKTMYDSRNLKEKYDVKSINRISTITKIKK